MGIWEKKLDVFNVAMLRAAACMCFFGFLCVGEVVVVPSDTEFNESMHLSVLVDDVLVNNSGWKFASKPLRQTLSGKEFQCMWGSLVKQCVQYQLF